MVNIFVSIRIIWNPSFFCLHGLWNNIKESKQKGVSGLSSVSMFENDFFQQKNSVSSSIVRRKKKLNVDI